MEENLSKDNNLNLLHEIRSWKFLLKHFENELIFIERQLNQTHSLAVSMIIEMKKGTTRLKNLLQDLKLEVISHECLFEGNSKNNTITPKNLIEEDRLVLCRKLEEFQKSFKFHKTKVLRFTGR